MTPREQEKAPGVRRWSVTNEMAAKQTASEIARDEVLLHLLKRGEASREAMADDLAARCGTNETVRRAVSHLAKAGDIEQTGGKGWPWRLTEAGRAKAVELQAQRAARRAT